MRWISPEALLLEPQAQRSVTLDPALNHQQFCQRVLSLAGHFNARRIQRIAVHLDDAAELAIALFAAWQAGVTIFLAADAQPHTRSRLSEQVDIWLDALPDITDANPATAIHLDSDACRLVLCTSGSSGEPKLIEKSLRQLATEVSALEQLWGDAIGPAVVVASVSAQHIYGLLFRVLWPLCAGRTFLRRAQPFSEDMQRASLAHQDFIWVASPALLKRMSDNLDWPALSHVRAVFSSGGVLPNAAAQSLDSRLKQLPIEIYGSSETGGIAWRQASEHWQPFAGVEVGVTAQGALTLTSPYLPAGQREETADAVQIETDGRFLLRARLDRIIKLEEKRVSLPMLEHVLSSHAWVSDARVGVLQQGRAFLGALIALSPAGLHALRNRGRRVVTQALRNHLGEHVEPIALPRRWRLAAELPYNSQGKLAQSQIEQLLAAPRTTQITPETITENNNEFLLTLRVPVDLAHFSGHFANTPVVPGVVQIDWVMGLSRQLLKTLPPRFAGMEVLKFQQLMRPGDAIELSLRFDTNRGKLYFAFTQNNAACSSGRILLVDHA
ncbi:AMP-binding protein [Pseudomonas sp. RL_15y_Pfl2_60]|uniref:AMP-binding protein n=1 Tax=Pseudomonas sp. RL_15y_Pfl2_60 TaxID=3088709 RepID=UPI0030D7FC73